MAVVWLCVSLLHNKNAAVSADKDPSENPCGSLNLSQSTTGVQTEGADPTEAPKPPTAPTENQNPPGGNGSTEVTAPSSGTWDRNAVYVGGDIVSYNGKQYRAKRWTQGETPGSLGQKQKSFADNREKRGIESRRRGNPSGVF